MPEETFPPMLELLPHRGRAVLLERVIAHDAHATVCAVDARAGALFRSEDGSTPSWVGLEYMAQAVAAHGGLLELERASATPGSRREAKPGFFVGTRRLTFAADRFDAGQALTATAAYLRGASGLLAFDCAVHDATSGATMVSGVLTVYLLESFEALVENFSADD